MQTEAEQEVFIYSYDTAVLSAASLQVPTYGDHQPCACPQRKLPGNRNAAMREWQSYWKPQALEVDSACWLAQRTGRMHAGTPVADSMKQRLEAFGSCT